RSSCSAFTLTATATPQLYPLSLHDALPICSGGVPARRTSAGDAGRPALPARGGPSLRDRTGRAEARAFLGTLCRRGDAGGWPARDRKSTRLNSSHVKISYAVFCLKKKKKKS